ncbi:MAG: DUF72 domain-containing protein [Chloroflexi bacterium]|nr:DUF72 domain-containing protein [Chloroflexota bacterium]
MTDMIRIGTAGWSYPTGEGRWSGIFYPEERKVDALEFYAHFFDTIEVNSTFYRPVPATVTRSWARKTPPDFRFTVKLFQKFTHPKMFEETTGTEAALGAGDVARFRAPLDPLAEADKLGPLLAQFPPSFKRDEASLAYLEKLTEWLADYELVVELRHRSWTEDESVARLLAARQVSWVRIDEPRFESSVGQVPITGPVGYFRFHGRNYRDWWRGDRETRYNYLYSLDEQSHLARQIADMAGSAQQTYVAYNNHYRAKAVANGLQMRLMLGQEVPEDVPEPLLAEYPDLASLIQHEAADRS